MDGGQAAGGGKCKTPSSLTLRLVSGFILGPAVLALICLSGWFFAAMATIVALAALYEFTGLIAGGRLSWLHYPAAGLYLCIGFGSFVFLHFAFDPGAWLVLCLILCVWASDTGAYFTGKTFGGPKMAPRLSPNKTWAGLGGAMGFCGLALVLLQAAGVWLRPFLDTDLGLAPGDAWGVLVAGLVFGAAGQGGDLLISYYKRKAGAKDSGRLIPGHGGVLDRIDSALLVSPVFLGAVLLCLKKLSAY